MADHLMQEQIKRYHEQLTANAERSQKAWLNALDYRDEMHQDLTLPLSHPPIARNMTALSGEPELFGYEEARRETRSERKKQESLEKQRRKAREAARKADELEGSESTYHMRLNQMQGVQSGADASASLSKEAYKREQAILEARLKAIEQQEKANIQKEELSGPVGEEKEKEIRLVAQEERVAAYHTIATQLPPGSAERRKYMAKKEEAVLKRGLLKQELKVAKMDDGAEKERDAATIKRHARFDFLKKIFRTVSPCSHEDAVVRVGNKVLVNKGRATLGGTKAMYEFEERDQQGNAVGQDWLFKEATNCIGIAKPAGAVVTEEASELQQYLRGELSIPAKCLRDGNGKVLGSIQKRVQKDESGVDLFKWQAQADLRVNEPSDVTKADLMNEHTLDWILCNFDTKGENFINQAGGHIISFDKEASFNTLLQEESKEMSYTFKPHSNDTIYNTMFAAYARGEIELDLHANLHSIRLLEAKEPDAFIAMFQNTLDAKYKAGTEDRAKAEQILRERHRNLRETYRKFYTSLIRERLERTRHPEEREKLQGMLVDNSFVFADEREDWAG